MIECTVVSRFSCRHVSYSEGGQYTRQFPRIVLTLHDSVSFRQGTREDFQSSFAHPDGCLLSKLVDRDCIPVPLVVSTHKCNWHKIPLRIRGQMARRWRADGASTAGTGWDIGRIEHAQLGRSTSASAPWSTVSSSSHPLFLRAQTGKWGESAGESCPTQPEKTSRLSPRTSRWICQLDSICCGDVDIQCWSIHQLGDASNEWLYDVHTTRMDDDVLERQLLVPTHLFSHYKQLHVYGQMNVCHIHIKQWSLHVR